VFQDTQPAPLGDGLDEFRVDNPAEVQALLRSLVDTNVAVHLSAPDGSHCSVTLWVVDAARRRLSFVADAAGPQLGPLLDAGEATAVAYLDSVKLQFDLDALVLVHGASGSALQAELPAQLFRFQRRSSFRVRTLPRNAPTVQFRHPANGMSLTLRVLDVSTGGCALFVPDQVPPLQPGSKLPRVRVELDASTRFEATLHLCHVTAINPQSNGVRVGCELLQMDGEAQRTLQRYIDQTQKRRRLLSLD
jgi:c-di-GMP-binding flagellar brake protein YcgR